jgi:hypothetical protein
MNKLWKLFFYACLILAANPGLYSAEDERPNILWIIIEDASCHISPYGEAEIDTPNIDALAADGVTFSRAFVTASVCSPSRSAMITGMLQTTLGDPHGAYHDIDASPSLRFLVENRDDPKIKPYFHLAVDKRPAEELYDIRACCRGTGSMGQAFL